MICPSCGEFVSIDSPKTCPFCGVDLEHFDFPNARSYGVTAQAAPQVAPGPELGMESVQGPDVSALQFTRSSGLSERGSMKFMDKRLPRCPFCRSSEPEWEHAVVSGWLNRVNFRCQKCQGVLSVPRESVASWRSPARLFGSMGASEYIRVEGVGNSPGIEKLAPKLVGGEFQVERLRTWAERQDSELPSSAA